MGTGLQNLAFLLEVVRKNTLRAEAVSIAYRQGWIDEAKMREVAVPMMKNEYGKYLISVVEEVKRTGQPNL